MNFWIFVLIQIAWSFLSVSFLPFVASLSKLPIHNSLFIFIYLVINLLGCWLQGICFQLINRFYILTHLFGISILVFSHIENPKLLQRRINQFGNISPQNETMSRKIEVDKLISFSDDLVEFLKSERDINNLEHCLEQSKALQSQCDADYNDIQRSLQGLPLHLAALNL